jgi:hypothetical protein
MIGGDLNAQQLKIADFLLFAGSGGSGTTTPPSPGYAVQIGSSTSVSGGAVGGLVLFQSTGNSTIASNIHSGGTVTLANSNTVTGKITAANTSLVSGTILSIGSSTQVTGNIEVNGNIVIGGGTVAGKVTHTSGTTYSGPVPGGGELIAAPALPLLPALPAVTVFPAAGTASITGTQSISPGSYGNVNLGGNKTLTLYGPGVYVFNTIKGTGNSNTFVFNFQNSASGVFYIYVHGDAILGKAKATMTNGGSASRIYFETHGTGKTFSNGTSAFSIANGSSGNNASKWLGTVYAPLAAINIGSGTGSTNTTGAM